MISKIKKSISNFLQWHMRNKQSLQSAHTNKCQMTPHIHKGDSLTLEEKRRIAEVWSPVAGCPIKRGHTYFIGIKNINGFDANYLPLCYFHPYILPKLNPPQWKKVLSHKALTEMLFGGVCEFPSTLIRSIGGKLFDSKYRPLSIEKCIELILKTESGMLYKPAMDSCQGKGIEFFTQENKSTLIEAFKDCSIFHLATDFVIQLAVSQSKETSIYNPTSLNCMRITTLNLNGKVTVCSRALKCGSKGSAVDNIGTGKRGVIIGINPDGTLRKFGFYGNGEMTYSHNGVTFQGRCIGSYKLIEDTAIELHKLNDKCKLIGWDLALDTDNRPVLIEANVSFPGISFEQMCSGPIFGERTYEVIQYIIDNKG